MRKDATVPVRERAFRTNWLNATQSYYVSIASNQMEWCPPFSPKAFSQRPGQRANARYNTNDLLLTTYWHRSGLNNLLLITYWHRSGLNDPPQKQRQPETVSEHYQDIKSSGYDALTMLRNRTQKQSISFIERYQTKDIPLINYPPKDISCAYQGGFKV